MLNSVSRECANERGNLFCMFMFTSVSSCSSTLNKRKCRTVEQPWSVLESIYVSASLCILMNQLFYNNNGILF